VTGRVTVGVLAARSSDAIDGTAVTSAGSIDVVTTDRGQVKTSQPGFVMPEIGVDLVSGRVRVAASLGALVMAVQGPRFTHSQIGLRTPACVDGGLGCLPNTGAVASEVAYRLDLKDWSPSTAILNLWAWRPTSPRAMRERRLHANATLLPTGEVLVTGGIDAGALDLTTPDARGVREPEIYDPYADKWSVPKEPASEVRNYHSVALLMPDGRVWTAGSDHNAGGGLGARNLNTEIFAPWYYGDPDRPYIKAAPSLAYPNETIYVESTHAKEIERVVLLRCGSCTHAFNPDQRLLELEFKHPTGDALLVKLPPDNFILPPGPYFIYTIRRKSGTLGLPSYGTDIYIVPERTPKDPPSEPGGH